ncbi:MAG TPA: helix-turn-helix transcriptional regulator [Candidatus Acidoferrum sp.]|nr:helix-turn-helix transcriptional regulator [Candidatus Acidoferrum sp.]
MGKLNKTLFENAPMGDLFATLSSQEKEQCDLRARFSLRVQKARRHSGLTQKAFAEKLGATQSQVSKWENGESNLTLETVESIFKKLDTFYPATSSPVAKKIVMVVNSYSGSEWNTGADISNGFTQTVRLLASINDNSWRSSRYA